MAKIDGLKVVNGVMVGDRFIMDGLGGNVIEGVYDAEGLRSLGRWIKGSDPVTLTIGEESMLYIPVELNGRIAKELSMIAYELEQFKGY